MRSTLRDSRWPSPSLPRWYTTSTLSAMPDDQSNLHAFRSIFRMLIELRLEVAVLPSTASSLGATTEQMDVFRSQIEKDTNLDGERLQYEYAGVDSLVVFVRRFERPAHCADLFRRKYM